MNSFDSEKRLHSFLRVLDETPLGRRMTQAIRLVPFDHKMTFIFKYGPAISVVPCVALYFVLSPLLPPQNLTLVVEISVALGLPALLSPVYTPKLMQYLRVDLVRKFEHQMPVAEVVSALNMREEHAPVEIQNDLRAILHPRINPWKPTTDADFFSYCAVISYLSSMARKRLQDPPTGIQI